MDKTILILGGYGVFGGRLAKRLAQDARLDVVVAGRSLSKARAFCSEFGGRPMLLDTEQGDFLQRVEAEHPFVLIDAAGPYQAYNQDPYKVAKAAIACGAHYFDLSDDAQFTIEIGQLDVLAKQASVSILSGVSSVPAISSVVADELSKGFSDIHLLESAILPGNRAPRGLSVMRSILGQAGRPIRLWRGGRWIYPPAWGDMCPVNLTATGVKPIKQRKASRIGAPDLYIFPARYRARSVLFRAGLELGLMQRGLWSLAWFARLKLVKSIGFLTPLLKWCADRLEPFGSDRGGMLVRLVGCDSAGEYKERRWTLIVEDGDGPNIPAVPGWIMVQAWLEGAVEPGARPALGEFSLTDLEAGLAPLKAITEVCEDPATTLFQEALGPTFRALSAEIADLHTVFDQRVWKGEATIERGKNLLSKIAGAFAGFPAAAKAVPVQVEMTTGPKGEQWVRSFGEKRFRSFISRRRNDGAGCIRERFGLLSFEIELILKDGKLQYPVKRGWCLGIPLPKFLRPKSDTAEFVDELGRACFDVSVSLPIAGNVVRYRGWLIPA
jgi:NAD(P)-dependent dehydrogenase (short-subunit alcohol dehydrogenase family)